MKKKQLKHRSLSAHSLQDPKFRQRVKQDKLEKYLDASLEEIIAGWKDMPFTIEGK